MNIVFATLRNTFDKNPVAREMPLEQFVEYVCDTSKRLSVDPSWTKEEYDAAKIKQKAIAPVGGRRKNAILEDSVVKFDFDHLNRTQYRDLTRKFVEREMSKEAISAWDRDSAFPPELLDRMAEIGLMGASIPEEYGGSGGGVMEETIILEELAKEFEFGCQKLIRRIFIDDGDTRQRCVVARQLPFLAEHGYEIGLGVLAGNGDVLGATGVQGLQ